MAGRNSTDGGALAGPDRPASLDGCRVLVVEDEVTIAMLMEDMLLDLGCEVVGPAGRLAAALDFAKGERIDAAIVDVNVAGQEIYPVAEVLVARGVPVIFSTGYGSDGLAEPFRGSPVLQKPFSQGDLERRLRAALG